MSNFRKVGEFHAACGLEVQGDCGAQWPLWETRKLRIDLIKEELEELIEANEKNDLVGIADALTDLLYVVYGAGHCYNMDLDACFDEVHRNNMT